MISLLCRIPSGVVAPYNHIHKYNMRKDTESIHIYSPQLFSCTGWSRLIHQILFYTHRWPCDHWRHVFQPPVLTFMTVIISSIFCTKCGWKTWIFHRGSSYFSVNEGKPRTVKCLKIATSTPKKEGLFFRHYTPGKLKSYQSKDANPFHCLGNLTDRTTNSSCLKNVSKHKIMNIPPKDV